MVSNRFRKKKKSIPIQQYVEGIKSGDRMTLAKAITLIESNHPDHFQAGQQLLKEILPLTGKSMRIGITGVPGAGKSTFIERFAQICVKWGRRWQFLPLILLPLFLKGVY